MKAKSHFPFQVSEPRLMTVLEQILCIMWLEKTHTLKQLRQKQDIINQQIAMAFNQKATEKTFQNLSIMYNHHSSAIAYKEFPTEDFWMCFIKH